VSRPRSSSRERGDPVACVAAGLAFASAACTAFRLLGGTAALDTVGGEVERLARERSAAAVAALALTLVLKLIAGVLALLLATPGDRRPPRWAVRLGLVGGIGLALYGGLLVGAGALALAGLFDGVDPSDQYALRWHVLFWDLWFFIWGGALALSAHRARRRSGA
jgi:hypothetical protein